jgi:exonuclease-1
MGIKGLLPFIKDAQKSTHIKEYAGKTLAIDAYVWLHLGVFSCALDLCMGNPTKRYFTVTTGLIVVA